MKTPAPSDSIQRGLSIESLRGLTPARVGLGRAGASMPTEALLAFTLDHARARDAVHAVFDAPGLTAELAGVGLNAFQVASQTKDRRDYLRRPDLGRLLDAGSRRVLAERRGEPCERWEPCELAVVKMCIRDRTRTTWTTC